MITNKNNIITVDENTQLLIYDNENIISTDYETDFTYVKNIENKVLLTLNSKYPYVIKNFGVNYASGTITTKFLSEENAGKYLRTIYPFLLNNKPKVVVLPNGRKILAIISNADISESVDGHYDNITMVLDYTEVSEVDMLKDTFNKYTIIYA